MKAMVLRSITNVDNKPLILEDLPTPKPDKGEILVKISVCGVCHTELDEIEGRKKPNLPIIIGHEIVGYVEKLGEGNKKFKIGDEVGVGWIYSSCSSCKFCRSGRENLCYDFKATGCDVNGGYAEYIVVPEDSAFLIPPSFSEYEVAPLMCAGAIGYRALKLADIKNGDIIGLYGFGASAHLIIQLIKHLYPNSKIFVFTKNRNDKPSKLAIEKGAEWVGVTGDTPPERLDKAIDTTPVGVPILEALRNLEKGGRLIINAIRKETKIPELDYATHVWNEKEIKSVANITRRDIIEFLSIAADVPIKVKINKFKLEAANEALISLKYGKYTGAGVLEIH